MNRWIFSLLLTISPLLYGITLQAKEHPKQCFCAFKPGARDKEVKDKPFVATLTNSKGQTFDICLCAKRDLERLQQNPSLIDLITEDDIKASNCCNRK